MEGKQRKFLKSNAISDTDHTGINMDCANIYFSRNVNLK